MPLDLDGDRRVDADGDRVLAARIEHTPVRLVGERAKAVQRRIELAQRGLREVDRAHQLSSHRYALAGVGSQTRATSMPGRSTSARYSVPNATQRSVSAITAGLQAIGSRNTPNPVSVPATKV